MKKRTIITTAIVLLLTIVLQPLFVALHSHVHDAKHHTFSINDQLVETNSQCCLCDYYFHKTALNNEVIQTLADFYCESPKVAVYTSVTTTFFRTSDLRGPPSLY